MGAPAKPNAGQPGARGRTARTGGASASLTPARLAAHQILTRVAEDGARATPLLDAAARRNALPPADVAWLTELVYGTLRHGAALEGRLQRHLRAPFARLPVPVQCTLRAGAYQLLYMRAPAYAAVDATVQALRSRYGALAGVANAVLRRLAEEAEAEREAENPTADDAPLGDAEPRAERAARADSATDFSAAPTRARRGSRPRASSSGPDAPAAVAPAPTEPWDERDLTAQTLRLAAAYSHPPWLVRCWLQRLGGVGAEQLLRANNDRPPLSLRVNIERATPEDVLARLRDAGHDARPSPVLPEGILVRRPGPVQRLLGFAEGHWSVQDMAPALVAHLLAPPLGGVAVDLCAAPGGKATHLAELVGRSGQVFAVDAHPGRLGVVESNALRLGHDHVVPVLADAASSHELGAALRAAGAPPSGLFDHVLVDPPCSGTGTLRRHPELRKRGAESLPGLLELQAQLLRCAAGLVAVGGRLVYAVCSLLDDEGQAQVRAFLAARPDFAAEPVPKVVARYAHDNALATWPHLHGLDGFYAACLRRVR